MTMSITRIKETGAGGSAKAYAEYVTAQLQGRETEVTEITAESAACYTAYLTPDAAQTTRWLGRQAEAFGLAGQAVEGAALASVLSHKDPRDGTDLDAARVARLATVEEKRARWAEDTRRWKASPSLRQRSAAFDALRDEIQIGAVHDLDAVLDAIDKHLGEHMTAKQIKKVADAATRALVRNEDLNKTLRAQQGRMRLVVPTKIAPRVSGSPTSAVIGYDLTLTNPRGVDLLLTSDALRYRAIAAKDRAVERTMRLLEDELTVTRAGAGGRHRHAVRGLTIAAVTHFTGRPAGDPAVADPELHTHCVIGALVFDPESGTWSTIDSKAWFRAKSMIQAVYDGEVRAEMTAEFGVAWRERTTQDPITNKLSKHWEMMVTGDGDLDDLLIESFSRRSADIKAEIAARRAKGEKVNKSVVWAATRNAKVEVPMWECRDEWAARMAAFAAEHNLDAEHLIEAACGRASDKVIAATRHYLKWAVPNSAVEDYLSTMAPEDVPTFVATWASYVGALAEDLAQQRATFGREHLLRVAMKHAPATASPSLIMAQVDAYLTYCAPTIVPRADEADPTSWMAMRWTTDAQIDREWEALVTLDVLMTPAGAAVSAATARAILEERAATSGALTAEQELLYLAALRDEEGGRLTACVAPAGAGKSYAAAAIAEAWRLEAPEQVVPRKEREAPTRKVVTLALASRAGVGVSYDIAGGADFMGSIDRLLVALEHDVLTLDANTLVIIDEASMASLVKLHAALDKIQEGGARVLIFGDPEQLDAPGAAGGILHWLNGRGVTVNFETTVRNRDEEIRKAQIAWRAALERDDAEAAASTLSTWVERDLVSIVDGEDAALELAFERWRARYEDGAARAAQWEADRQSLARALEETPKKSVEREALEIARSAHTAEHPDTSTLVMAERHEDVAVLSDRIADYLIARGAIDGRTSVAGVRYARRTEEQVDERIKPSPMTSSAGVDLSKVRFMRGLEVRVGDNTKSGHLEVELKKAIAKEKAAYRGKAPWEDRFAWGRSEQVRDLAKALKESALLNGELGRVETVHADGGCTVRIPGGRGTGDRLVRMTQDQLMDGLLVPAAGGTITVHAAQGRTVENSITVVSARSAGDLLYTALSRAKDDAEVIFMADTDLKDPRLAQFENDARKAHLNGEEFTREPPTETIPGLWQLAQRWATSHRSTLAVHEADKAAVKEAARANARRGDHEPEIAADAFVLPGDQSEALELLSLQGDGDVGALAQQIANHRIAQERVMAAASEARRAAIQRTEGMVRQIERDPR